MTDGQRRATTTTPQGSQRNGDIIRPVSAETAETAGRLGVAALALQVVGVADDAPALRRLTVHDPRLAELPWRPGQDLTLCLPAAARSVKRRYTIRRLDRASSTAELLVLLHEDGPGARWAAGVRAGDHLEAVGPRGKIWADEHAGWHLFVGDETYLAATAAMAESLPAGTRALVVLQVGDDVGPQPISAAAGLQQPVWVRRNPLGAGEPGVELIDALAALVLPDGLGHAYVGGEHHAVAAVRACLLGRGLPDDAISSKAYWRADKPNQDHGEPARD